MAARINKPLHAEKTKDLIRATQLLNRLYQCANGKVEMSNDQITAARIVINKRIPDAKAELAVEHSGEIQIIAPWLQSRSL